MSETTTAANGSEYLSQPTPYRAPAQLRQSPHKTARVDQMSLAKWNASVASAGEPVRSATERSCRERQ